MTIEVRKPGTRLGGLEPEGTGRSAWVLLPALLVFWGFLAWRRGGYVSEEFALWVEQADGIRWADLKTFYHPVQPIGYPLALRALSAVLGDYRPAGLGLSLVSASLCVVALARLFQRFQPGFRTSALALALIGLERFFVYGAISPGNEMIHLLLLTLACLTFCKEEWTRGEALLTGLAAGAGFLNTYAMLWFLPAMALCLGLGHGKGPRIQRGTLILLGFLVPVIMQLSVNAWATGDPLGGKPAQLAYLLRTTDGNYGDLRAAWTRGDTNAGEADVPESLGAVAANVVEWLGVSGYLFHIWLFLALPGALSLLRGRPGITPAGTYVLVNAAFLVHPCLVPPAPAFVLFLLPPVVFLGATFLARDVFPRLPGGARLRSSAAFTAFLSAVILLAARDIRTFAGPGPEVARNLEVQRALDRLGANTQSDLLEVGTGFSRVAASCPLPYPGLASSGAGSTITVDSLKELLVKRGARYLLFGEPHGLRRYPRLWILLGPERRDPELDLIKAWKEYPSVALYRLRPGSIPEGDHGNHGTDTASEIGSASSAAPRVPEGALRGE